MGARALLLLGLVLVSAPVSAATREVGPGQTYTTIQACETAASAGDVCNIHAGTYTETVTISGVANLTFQNHAGDSPVLVGRMTVSASATGTTITCNNGAGQMSITGFGTALAAVTGGIEVQSSTGLTVTGCVIHTAYGTGFYARNSTKGTFTGNTIYGMQRAAAGASASGISLNSSHSTDDSYNNGWYLTNNVIYDNAVDGIDIHGDYITVSGNDVYNNLTTDWATTHPDGIQAIKSLVDGYQDVRHVRIFNNIFRNHTQNIWIEGTANDAGTGDGCVDVSIWNNVVYSDTGTINGVDMDTLNTKGIAIAGCKDVYVYNNTIGRHFGYGFLTATAGGGFKNTDGTLHFKNNILQNSLEDGFSVSEAADFSAGEFDYNQYQNADKAGTWVATTYATRAAFTAGVPTQEVHGQDGDALVNAFPTPTLQSGSPVINAGVDLSGECVLCSTDKAGVVRAGAWEMGAYAFGAGGVVGTGGVRGRVRR